MTHSNESDAVEPSAARLADQRDKLGREVERLESELRDAASRYKDLCTRAYEAQRREDAQP